MLAFIYKSLTGWDASVGGISPSQDTLPQLKTRSTASQGLLCVLEQAQPGHSLLHVWS